MSKHVSPEEVVRLAALSALTLSEDEINRFKDQFGKTLDYIKNIDHVETSSVSQSSHMSGKTNATFEDGGLNERGLSTSDALKNSKRTENGYFVVDKVL
jgi:aspartyl/glutamyl-tRNA(Asn/Gln) amidotransferase C subunit